MMPSTVKITQELFLSPDFQALSYGTRMLYVAMLAECDSTGVCTFDIDAANDYDFSYNAMKANRKALKDAGFVEYVGASEFLMLRQGEGKAVILPADFLLSDSFLKLKSSDQLIYLALWMESNDCVALFGKAATEKYGFNYMTIQTHIETIRQAKLLRCKDIEEYRLMPVDGLEVIS